MGRALNTNVCDIGSRRKMCLQTPGSVRKQWVTMNSIVDTTRLLVSPRTFGGCVWGAVLWSHKGHQNVDLNSSTNRLLDFFFLFKHEWVYLVSVENCNSGSAIMQSYTCYYIARKGKLFCRKERKGTGMTCCKQRVHGSSLAKSLPGRKRGLFSSCWSLWPFQGMRDPPSDLPTLLIEVLFIYFLYYQGRNNKHMMEILDKILTK